MIHYLWITIIAIYIIGFLYQFQRRCLCLCGEIHFSLGSLIGIIYALFWFILVPIEFVWTLRQDYLSNKVKRKHKIKLK